MSHLKDAVRALAKPLPRLVLSEVPAIVRATERIPDRQGGDRRRPSKDYDAIAARVLARARAGLTPAETSVELRDAAWCLWMTEPALAHHAAALTALLRAIEQVERKAPSRALASSYVTSYAPGLPGLAEVSASLVRIAHRLGRPWAELQATLQLLDWQQAPIQVAQRALTDRTPPNVILRQAGLGNVNADAGLAKTCAAATLAKIAEAPQLSANDHLSFVQDLALNEQGGLIFEEHAPLVANALVLPFQGRMPDKVVRDRYLNLLLRLFNDPRLPGGRWARMSAAAEQVRRWLAEQALRQFLDVVDRVLDEVPQPERKRMWAYRRAFWEAVYRAGLIDEAWVVFDKRGEEKARRYFGRDISFATFDGSVQAGQAVLLLRVGRGVVAEWSDNGKYIIWDDAEINGAPKLYCYRYLPDVLREPVGASCSRGIVAGAHHGAEAYNWQRKVAAKIQSMTRTRIPESEYRVRYS